MKLPPNAITTNNLDVGTDFCGVYLLVDGLWDIHVNATCERFKRFFWDTTCGHYMWTLHVNAFFIFVNDFGRTLHVDAFFIFLNIFPEHDKVVHPD